EDDAAAGQVHAGEVVERAVGELAQVAAVEVDLVQVKPILAVAAHGEEDLLAVEGRLRPVDCAGLEVGQARELAVRPGRHEGGEVAAGARLPHGTLAAVEGRAARVDVAVAPVVAALVDAFAAVGSLVEDGGADEDYAGEWVGGRGFRSGSRRRGIS